MKTRNVLLSCAVLALLGLLAAGVSLSREVPSEAPTASAPTRFDFPRSKSWTYRLDYESSSHVRLSNQDQARSLSGKMHLVGDLVLRGYGRQGDTLRVGLRLERLGTYVLELFGQQVLPDQAAADATFRDREAVLEVAPDGEVRAVSFRAEDPALFKNTVQSLVSELQVVLRDGDAWSVEETTPRGVARTQYTRVSEDAARVRVLKQRTAYVELRGMGQGGTSRVSSRFEADVAREGVLDRISGDETVERLGANGQPMATSQVHLSLTRGASAGFTDEAGATVASARERLSPGVMVMDPKVREQLLEQQVDGMTPERLLSLLEQNGRGGVMPDHNHFLLQATGLLRQHPEVCARMVEVFESPSLDEAGRALVLDLLAGTGTPQAQEALVRALSTKTARGDAAYSMLLSRLSLVAEPTLDTVRFAERTYASSQGKLHVASSYILGATAGALYRQDKSPEALAVAQRLVTDLRAAREPEAQAHLLSSLGNAGVPEQASAIIPYADSENPEVRRAAAMALRKIQAPEVTRTLLGLAADTALPVQGTALDALSRQKLDADTLVHLRDMVMEGKVVEENFPALVTLVEPYLQTEPAVRDLLEHLLTVEVKNRQIRSRIRGLLGT